ncbi:Uncharacterized protein HZ326_19594 [Fusarium oxysporum f. sp. albedinis]|nr:Uncharacterized protein HZ326_19594 [Fusarium oxysporum f. sp. albedinis]
MLKKRLEAAAIVRQHLRLTARSDYGHELYKTCSAGLLGRVCHTQMAFKAWGFSFPSQWDFCLPALNGRWCLPATLSSEGAG